MSHNKGVNDFPKDKVNSSSVTFSPFRLSSFLFAVKLVLHKESLALDKVQTYSYLMINHPQMKPDEGGEVVNLQKRRNRRYTANQLKNMYKARLQLCLRGK